MAKRRTKGAPARKPAADREDDSLLIRSAESLGRVIGSLQRQMQGATKRVSAIAEDALEALPELQQMEDVLESARKATGIGAGKSAVARKAAAKRAPAAGRKSAASAKRTASSTRGARAAPAARKPSAGTRKATRRKASRGSR
jgi:hypothetical protein